MKRYRIILLLFACVCASMRAQDSMQYPKDTVDGQIYCLYTVERGIGLYRISKNFGVTQELLLKTNPHLQYQGLTLGETIRIPIGKVQVDAIAKELPAQVVPMADTLSQEPLEESQKVDTTLLLNDSVIRLAMMLPLHADAVKRTKVMERFYDFYTGALIAINEVQKQGQEIEVLTYDVGKTAQKISQVFADSAWQKVDAIIGPAYAGQVSVAAEYAKQDSTWLLVPFLPNVDEIATNPYILKFNPSAETEVDSLVHYLAQNKDSINCVLLEMKEGDVIPQSIASLHAMLKKQEIPTTTIALKYLLLDSLDGAFVEGKENIVIFNTEKFSNLNIVMPHLLNGYSKYKITLYSHYSWQNEKIILPQIYTSIFKEDYAVPAEYDSVYQAYFGHPLASDLPRYDLLGYDVTLQLLRMLQAFQTDSSICQPSSETWYGVQSNISYQSIAPAAGYENREIYVIRR